MSDAFVYMFVVGAGASCGVAVVGLATYKLFMFMEARKRPKKSKRGIV